MTCVDNNEGNLTIVDRSFACLVDLVSLLMQYPVGKTKSKGLSHLVIILRTIHHSFDNAH